MFQHILKTITDWPVIIQGALGSALFAVLLFLGQKLSFASLAWFQTNSRQSRKTQLLDKKTRLEAFLATESVDQAKYASALIYRAMRHLIKGLIWLMLGLALGHFISILAVVGYLGCLFYSFKGLNVIAPMGHVPNAKEEISKLIAELDRLEKA